MANHSEQASESRHTPAPWTITDHGPNPSTGIRYTIKGDVAHGNYPVCDLFYVTPVGEANARLIAAAPALLDALERICKSATECEMLDGPSRVDGIDWADIVSARSAIALAKPGAKS